MSEPTIDGTDRHYHVRECNNCVRVVISQQGERDYYYVFYEVLSDTGRIDEGQPVREWKYVDGSSTRGYRRFEAESKMTEMYRDAKERMKKLGVDWKKGKYSNADDHEKIPELASAMTAAYGEVAAAGPMPTPPPIWNIVNDVLAEARRQDELKAAGRFKYHCGDDEMTDVGRFAVLGEEVGEVARAALENADLANDKHGKNLRKELVQVAAVCVKWIAGMDRRAVHHKFETTSDEGPATCNVCHKTLGEGRHLI